MLTKLIASNFFRVVRSCQAALFWANFRALLFTFPRSHSAFILLAVRVPWPITFISLIGVILITWFMRTGDMDFMTPEKITLAPEDFGADLAVGVLVMQPKIKNGPKIDFPTQPVDDEVPVVAEITDEELGDLESAPGLDEYRQYALNHSAAKLLALSSTLQARGDFQRALLALERVIDSCPQASSEELKQAIADTASLSPTLPRWNVDPVGERSLILRFGSWKTTSEELKTAALEIATLIRKNSGDQLKIIPKVEVTSTETGITDPPIALWISGTQNGHSKTGLIPVRSDNENLTDALTRGTFLSVRGYLANLGYPFPRGSESIPAVELLSRHITRSMWRDLAIALTKESESSN